MPQCHCFAVQAPLTFRIRLRSRMDGGDGHLRSVGLMERGELSGGTDFYSKPLCEEGGNHFPVRRVKEEFPEFVKGNAIAGIHSVGSVVSRPRWNVHRLVAIP